MMASDMPCGGDAFRWAEWESAPHITGPNCSSCAHLASEVFEWINNPGHPGWSEGDWGVLHQEMASPACLGPLGPWFLDGALPGGGPVEYLACQGSARELHEAVTAVSTTAAKVGVSFGEVAALMRDLASQDSVAIRHMVQALKARQAIDIWQALPWYKRTVYWLVSTW